MGATVIFEAEPLVAVVQVKPADDSQETITDSHLRLRPRQAREHQHHAQSSLHRRLGRRFHVLENLAQQSHACGARGRRTNQVLPVHLSCVERHVRYRDRLCQ